MRELRALVELLADGRFRSGRELGERLGITRAAVWKRLQRLPPLGVGVHSVRGRGYRLERPLDLLEVERLRGGLGVRSAAHCPGIDVVFSVDSTSAWLGREAASLAGGHACLAEHQSAGRGRRGRDWVSPFGSNVYLSVLWRFESAAQLSGLSLAVAVGVAEALEAVGARGLTLKWPNDLLFLDRKLAGILIEVSGEADGECQVIVGVGVNLGMPSQKGGAIDQPWADLSETGARLDRNEVAGALLDRITETLLDFESTGLGPFLDPWRARDGLIGQPISVRFPDRVLHGTARGIDADGRFLVEHGRGLQRLHYGEVSLRRSVG